MKNLILAGLATVLALAMFSGCALVPDENALTEVPVGDVPDEIQPIDEIYVSFAVARGENSALVNPLTGEAYDFLPEGYSIPDQHNYMKDPSVILLRKDDKLYEFNYRMNEFEEIELEFDLTEDQIVRVWPSISEADKFYLEVQTIKPLDGMMPYEVTQSVSIYYDAATNDILYSGDMGTPSSPVIFENRGCMLYDSVLERFINWYCGEGIGSGAPLEVWDIDALETKTIIDADVMNGEIIPLKYSEGFIYADIELEREPGYPEKAIQIFDATDKNFDSKVLVYGKAFQSEDMEIPFFSYSLTHVPEKELIIFGQADGITILSYDSEKGIIEGSEKLNIPELYANFIFTDGQHLLVKDSIGIYVIDLDNPKVTKPAELETKGLDEFTLFYMM